MIHLIIFILFFSFGSAGTNKYSLSIWGIPCGEVTWSSPSNDTVRFKTESVGLVNAIWAFNNSYETHYDSVSYKTNSFSKSIDQVNTKQSLSSVWDSGLKSYVYDTGDIISAPDKRLNIFTAMIMAANKTPNEIDAIKMPMLLEGEFYQVRLVWVGKDTLNISNKAWNTDHYRIDFLPEKGGRKVLELTDFFHEYLVHPKAIKQLWVNSDNPRGVVQAAVTLNGITIYGRIKE